MAQSSLAGQHRAAGLPCTPLSLPVRGVPYLRWILASLKEFSGAVFQGQGRPPAGCLSLFLPFPSAATTNTHKKSLLAFPQLAWIRGCVFLSKSLSRTLAWQVRARKRREERERAREGERERKEAAGQADRLVPSRLCTSTQRRLSSYCKPAEKSRFTEKQKHHVSRKWEPGSPD